MESMGPELSKTVLGMSLGPLDRFLGPVKVHSKKWKIAKNRYFLAKIAKIRKNAIIQFRDKVAQNCGRSDFGWPKVHTITKSRLHQQNFHFS